MMLHSDIQKGKYTVFCCGCIYNAKRNRPVSKRIGRGGYLYVSLYEGGKNVCISVHKLVASCFVNENFGCNMVVNHKDGNKHNNHYSNLEWVTVSENVKHAYKIGLSKISSNQKLNTSIRFGKMLLDTDTGIFYNSIREAANANCIVEGTLRKKLLGQRPKQTRFVFI